MKTKIKVIGMLLLTTMCFSQIKQVKGNYSSNYPKEVLAMNTQKKSISYQMDKDFVWDLPELVQKMGYSSITMSKGVYAIYKDKKHPFGKLTVNVAGGEKLNVKETLSSESFIIRLTFRSGFYKCDLSGILCCKMGGDNLNSVKIQPVIVDNNLKAIEVEFLTADITNGEKLASDDANESMANKPETTFYKIGMINIVNQVKRYYKKGQTVDEFVKTTGTTIKELNANEQELVKDIYKYLSNNSTDIAIYKDHNGTSIENIIKGGKINESGAFRIKGFWEKVGKTLTALGDAITYIVCVWEGNC